MDPDVIAMAARSPLSARPLWGKLHLRVRLAGRYRPARISASRRSTLSWGIPEYNTFGTDEFLRFCELIHAQPQVALNLGTGTSAAGRRVGALHRQALGNHKGGLLWELGNELWGDFQIGYPSPSATHRSRLPCYQPGGPQGRPARPQLIATGGDEDFYTMTGTLTAAHQPAGHLRLSLDTLRGRQTMSSCQHARASNDFTQHGLRSPCPGVSPNACTPLSSRPSRPGTKSRHRRLHRVADDLKQRTRRACTSPTWAARSSPAASSTWSCATPTPSPSPT